MTAMAQAGTTALCVEKKKQGRGKPSAAGMQISAASRNCTNVRSTSPKLSWGGGGEEY